MKNLIVLWVLLLTGCGTMQAYNMLDTAPPDGTELKYPEWGEPEPQMLFQVQSQSQTHSLVNRYAMVEGPDGIKKSDTLDSVSYYLSQLGIDYDILPGDHQVIKLNKKVQFSNGSDAVSDVSRTWLSQLGHYVSAIPDIDIIIEGHSDSTGSSTVKEKLSEKRAMMVKKELVKQNVSATSIYTRGYSDYIPKCTNQTKSGRACNRRVELSFILAGTP